tara:strand:- start:12754 stop:13173 length:420 start_codon:yes stop_codon:yes gene_type:complete
MEFCNDIWNEIMSYFHSSYKKPLHYQAFISIELYKDYKNTDSRITFIDEFDTINVIDNTLYRYILDDYSFCRNIALLDRGKWNPFMCRYSWLTIILNLSEVKEANLWNSNYNYNKLVVKDFKTIIQESRIPLTTTSVQH